MIDLIILTSSLKFGGAESIACNLITFLPDFINKKVIIRCQSDNNNNNNNSKRQKYLYFFKKLPIKIQNISSSIGLPILALPPALRYRKEIETNKPKISLSISCGDNFINILSCQFKPTIPIISCHYMPSYYLVCGGYLMNKITYMLAKYSKSKIIAVSEGVSRDLKMTYRIPDNKISVIYNPINIASIIELAKEIILENDSRLPLIITVGRLSEIKAQHHLIRVFAQFVQITSAMLLICGDGPERDYLEHLSRDLGINDNIIFLGWQENPYKYISKSTVFVQSSLSEALPNVLIESMACGCPVVAANCSSGIEEILGSDNTCGFIAEKMTGIRHTADEPLDSGEQSLLLAMEKILNNPELRESMSKAGKERAKLFDMEVGIRKYTELIEELSKNY